MRPLTRLLPLFAMAAIIVGGVGAARAEDPLQTIRRAVTLEIEIQTNRTPTALRLSCGDTTKPVIHCAATWRNKRYAYDGRVTVSDDGEDALAIAFKGTRVDRACAARRKGSAKRRCRRAYSF